MKVKKIKSYTCLALALTLVLPVTAHASDEVEKEMLSLTSDEKTSDNGQQDSLLYLNTQSKKKLKIVKSQKKKKILKIKKTQKKLKNQKVSKKLD